ncbi:MAG: SCO family protein [Gammaproteobacteria bacterium]
MTETIDIKQRNRARRSLVLLFVMFSAPVVLAWYIYFAGTEWIPKGRVNQGELVVPARPLKLPLATDLDGKPFDTEPMFAHYWTMVYLGDNDCDQHCKDQLYKIRQVRIGTNKNMYRVATAFFVSNGKPPVDIEFLRTEHPKLTSLIMENSEALMDQFRVGDEPDAQAKGRIYMVDPLGNLMMRYAPDVNPSDIAKDLKRLLKVSAVR